MQVLWCLVFCNHNIAANEYIATNKDGLGFDRFMFIAVCLHGSLSTFVLCSMSLWVLRDVSGRQVCIGLPNRSVTGEVSVVVCGVAW